MQNRNDGKEIEYNTVGGGGWLESELSDRIWLEPSLGQAEQ